jgi:Periplasmic protease
MFRRTILTLVVAATLCRGMVAQVPSPATHPERSVPPKGLIDTLSQSEIDEAIRLLKSNFIDPNALKDQQISRATLEGLLTRLNGGVLLLPANANAVASTVTPFYPEILSNHIGYARIGSLRSDNLDALDKALANFAAKKVDAMVIDLRASSSGNEFDMAAEVTKRFAPKGKTLWTLRKTANHEDRSFVNERDPSFQGIVMVLVDSETSGAAEPIAAALKADARALLIGQSTAGRALEYSDFPLGTGKMLRVAVGQIILPDGHSLFPTGINADLPVDTTLAQKHQIFSLSGQRGMAPFVFEAERPHFNEAALMAGTNPELESRKRNPDDNLHDAVLQRAVDVIASISVFQRR